MLTGPLYAANVLWDGGGLDNNWTTAANWVGDVAPAALDNLEFPGGAARLTNTNDYPNGTVFNSITFSSTGYSVSGNTIDLGAGGLTATAAAGTNTLATPLTLAATPTFTTDAGTTTLSGVISGAGGITKAGTATLTLSGNNTYTGNISINAGTLSIQGDNTLGAVIGGTTIAAGATLQLQAPTPSPIAEGLTINGSGVDGNGAVQCASGNNSISGTITLASDSTLGCPTPATLGLSGSVNNGGFLLTLKDLGTGATTVSGVISGSGGLTKDGTGRTTLSGANTYAGATTVSAGILSTGNNSGLGSAAAGTTVLSGGTLELTGTVITPEPLTLNGTGAAGASGALQSGIGGQFITSTGPVTLGSNTTIAASLPGSSALVLEGVISGGFDLNIGSNNNQVILRGVNTYSGLTTVSSGALFFENPSALGSALGGTVVQNGAALVINGVAGGFTVSGEALTLNGSGNVLAPGALSNGNGNNTWTGPVTLASAASVSSGTTTLTLSGVISGAAGADLTKIGAGTLVFSGANTIAGAVAVNAGKLNIQNSSALGTTTAGTTVATSATLELQGGISVGAEALTLNDNTALDNLGGINSWAGDITLAGNASINIGAPADRLILSGVISGPGGISTTGGGAGALQFAGTAANTFSGSTDLLTGTLELNKSPGVNAIAGNVASNDGSGSDGFVRLLASDQIADTSAVTVTAGGKLDLNNFNETVGSLAGAGDVAFGDGAPNTLTVGNATNTTLSGVISGADATDSLVKVGTGTWMLSGANSYAAATTVSAGILSTGNNSGLGSAAAGTTVLSGGTLELTGTISTPEPLTLNGAGAAGTSGALQAGTGGQFITSTGPVILGSNVSIASTSSSALAVYGIISGAFDLTIPSGSNLVILAGVNTYTGLTTIGGFLSIDHPEALGSPAVGTVVQNGATLKLYSSTGGFTVTDEALTLNGPGILAEPGALVNGLGTNIWTGPITLGSAASILSPVNPDGSAALTLSGVISGAAGADLTKLGASSLTLTAANTYAGATAVSAGTLAVNNTSGSGTGSGAVTVASGATLTGKGTLSGAVTVSGNLAPGDAGVGALSVGALSLNSGASLNFELGAPGTGDTVSIAGNLALNGALNVANAGGFGAGVYPLFSYTGTLTPNPVTINPLPNGLQGAIGTSAPGQVRLLAGASLAPSVGGVSLSQNTASTGTSVNFSAAVSDPNSLPLSFTWDFADGATSNTNPASHAYTIEGSFTVSFTATNGFVSSSATAPITVLGPNSGGQGVVNVSDGKPAVANPLNGITTRVVSSNGGVIELEVNLDALIRDAFSVSTSFDGIAGRFATRDGLRPIHKFTQAGVSVATSTATEIATGQAKGQARKTLVVSRLETGEPALSSAPPAKREIILKGIKGKFYFASAGARATGLAGRSDSVSFKGSFELPAGVNVSQAQELAVGIGNILDSATVDGKGKQSAASALTRIKKVKVKYPKLPKGTTTTSAGQMASLDVTLSMAGMSAGGFDTEGVSAEAKDLSEKNSATRKIQMGLLFAGTSYEASLPVEFKLSKARDSGQIAGRGVR